MRRKKVVINFIVSSLLQLVTIVCGLVLPRVILVKFGSEINGLVASITQFLGYITLLEVGIGGVTRAALYKPLADDDKEKISSVMKVTENFYHKLAFVFVVYSVALATFFPYINNNGFSYFFNFSLIIIISISTCFQYFYGMTSYLLISADMKAYISGILQIVTIVLNTIISVVLMHLGFGIHVVKLASSIVYIIRPLALYRYVNKYYSLDRKCKLDKTLLPQRWDGFWQHIAYVLHKNTDVAVLTILTTLKEVSVYSVYYMIVSALVQIATIITNATEAAFGNIIAKKEKESLDKNFDLMDFIMSSCVIVLFTTAGFTITSFVMLYTNNVSDANYNRPLFALLLLLAEAVYCIRQPYHTVCMAAGHYRITKYFSIGEVIINIVLSIVLVINYGIIGVAIGTLIAVLFRTICYALYMKNHILCRSVLKFVRRQIVTLITVFFIYAVTCFIDYNIVINNYLDWSIKAIYHFVVAIVCTVLVAQIAYKEEVMEIANGIKNFLRRK